MVTMREKEYRREAAEVNVGKASRLILFKKRKSRFSLLGVPPYSLQKAKISL
jgi:hypothetical protein